MTSSQAPPVSLSAFAVPISGSVTANSANGFDNARVQYDFNRPNLNLSAYATANRDGLQDVGGNVNYRASENLNLSAGVNHNFQTDRTTATAEASWKVNGKHYERTCNDWLQLEDLHRDEVMKVLRGVYRDAAAVWFQRWRIFFMACAELFRYDNGREWFVSHYRFARRA